MTGPNQRPLRADAVRNRAKVLSAARDQITAHGPGVGMDAIASAAGVAVGTLYRHFPTKTDLVTAVLASYVAEIAVDAQRALERVEEGATPIEELVDFLARVTESTARNHAVKAAAAGLGVSGHGDADGEDAAARTLADLLEHARRARQVDPSITVDDVYLLVATAPTDRPARERRRWLQLVVPGLIAPYEPVG